MYVRALYVHALYVRACALYVHAQCCVRRPLHVHGKTTSNKRSRVSSVGSHQHLVTQSRVKNMAFFTLYLFFFSIYKTFVKGTHGFIFLTYFAIFVIVVKKNAANEERNQERTLLSEIL